MKLPIITLLFFVLVSSSAIACDACQLQQPKITQGITHGAGPTNNWDWAIVSIVALITILTLILSVKYLVWPGEKKSSHIKNVIINQQYNHGA